MEPYLAMMDFRIFSDHLFLELSTDAQSRFAQLIGTCDRMGTANLYQIWNNSRIKPAVMTSLYESGLVWEVDAYYCFIPSVFYANNKIRSGKYKASFDVKGFQACVNRYPEITDSMNESELNFIQSKGVFLPKPATLNKIISTNSPLVLPSTTLPQSDLIPEDDYTTFCGEIINRKDYWKCRLLKDYLNALNHEYNAIIMTEPQVEEWFMDKYHKNYTVDGKVINDLNALFKKYCETVLKNKIAQNKLIPLSEVDV